ncbi:glutaredoxin family protein [Tamlana sp. 62-3]|uniref:Glutaredoxin family protein n=1 Tax=Neotamlana sargassicola TaxID=2883125 RepID=A0A9X1L6L9_9FLAO|nr:glutaredoxin family protein [Tamlana sargassicola]MCB4806808.1 glutaredoxin family protein [Tamlana sargassicola]
MQFIFKVFFIGLFSYLSSSAQVDNNQLAKAKNNKIIVYGSDSCHYCVDTKAFLKKNNVEFRYFDVDVNITMQREMLLKMEKSGLSVDELSLPVVDLQGQLIMNDVADFEGFLKQLISKNKTK